MLILFQPWKSSSEEKEQKLFFFYPWPIQSDFSEGNEESEGIYAKIRD